MYLIKQKRTSLRRLYVLPVAAAMAVLAGCNTGPATDAENGTLAETDTVTAIHADTTAAKADTTAAGASGSMADADSAARQPVKELTLHAIGNSPEEMHFDLDTLKAEAGALIKLQLTNEAQDMPMVHNLVITAPGKYREVALAGEEAGASGNYVPASQNVIAASPIALPGQTIELEFTAPARPGVYDFVCTYPEHWQRMHGKFIVE
ncbi:plastocyanin/azurin family copper-binding protein [Pontibacter rufus]|uniref:plastocyanin/azurin family copper-binding protein n=1 Tax=Pontibacter rufus TaxID=2791028 RepID=UPI0018B016F9